MSGIIGGRGWDEGGTSLEGGDRWRRVPVRWPAVGLLVMFVASVLVGAPLARGATGDNPVVTENNLPGSTGWRIPAPGNLVANDADRQIKGYASATSVNKGETIGFNVSVNPAQSFTVDVYRLGWYGGTGGRLMRSIGPVSGATQPGCPMDAT